MSGAMKVPVRANSSASGTGLSRERSDASRAAIQPMPRRGSWFVRSTSAAMDDTPSPTTCPGTRLATATSSPFTTSIR